MRARTRPAAKPQKRPALPVKLLATVACADRRGGPLVAAAALVLLLSAGGPPLAGAAPVPEARAGEERPAAGDATRNRATAPSAGDLRLSPGDRELATEVVADAGVARHHPERGWVAYLGWLAKRLTNKLLQGLLTTTEALGGSGFWAFAGRLLMAAALAALLVWLVHLTLRGWRRRKRDEPAAEAPAVTTLPAAPRRGQATGFRQAVDRHLAAGQVAEALEAVWWWLAASVAGEGADPAWTGRELVERSGRRDLVGDVRLLDRLTYGRRRPAAAEVERFVRHLDGVLA